MLVLKDLLKNCAYPIAMLSGSIIGVGFFALPYIAMKTGIWLMLAYFLVLTGVIVLIHLIFCEISLKTPDFKRFPGFAGFYLGKRAAATALICSTVGAFGVLLAYLIVGGEFLTNIFQPIFGGSNFLYTLIYFSAAGAIIFFGVEAVSKVNLWILIALFLSLIFILIEGFSKIKLSNIFIPDFASGARNLFLPYGPLLFAMWGTGLIPEVEEMLIGKKKLVKRIVIIATLIPAIFYLLFVFLILGITGSQTTETSLPGLKIFLGNGAITVALFAGVMSTFIAFVAQGFLLKKTLILDLKIKNWHAFVISCFPPLILFLMGFKSFIALLGLLGGVLLGVSGILILLMYKKIGGKNILIYPLSLVFLSGVIYEIIYFFR